MVLSNKKLKQKLREEAAKFSGSEGGNSPNLQSQSLKQLLHSATRRSQLSKREKRRNKLSLNVLESSGVEVGEKQSTILYDKDDGKKNGLTSKEDAINIAKTTKKRKRKDVESGESGVHGSNEVEKKSKKSRRKKKEKKKNMQGKNEQKNVERKAEGTDLKADSHLDGTVQSKIYVGGIPYHYTEDEIRSYFKGCGNILQVDLKMRAEDQRFSGIAFITFEGGDAAQRALALDRAAMGERFLTIQPYVNNRAKKASDFAPKMVEGYNKIYIGNLSWDITEHDIRKLFSDCIIKSLRLGKNKDTGEFKGYAHVDFKDNVSTAMALKLDQEIVRGRPVKISCAVPKCSDDSNPPSLHAPIQVENGNTDLKSGSCVSDSTNAASGKIRRRICYECGEKGHLSSACPTKQNNDQTSIDAA